MKQYHTKLLEAFHREFSDFHCADSGFVAKLTLMRMTHFLGFHDVPVIWVCGDSDTTADITTAFFSFLYITTTSLTSHTHHIHIHSDATDTHTVISPKASQEYSLVFPKTKNEALIMSDTRSPIKKILISLFYLCRGGRFTALMTKSELLFADVISWGLSLHL